MAKITEKEFSNLAKSDTNIGKSCKIIKVMPSAYISIVENDCYILVKNVWNALLVECDVKKKGDIYGMYKIADLHWCVEQGLIGKQVRK